MARSKDIAERKHARRRALQRYDLDLRDEDLDLITGMIQTGKATFVEKQSNRVSVFTLKFKEKDVKVVYDRQRQNIVTFLPIDGNFDTIGALLARDGK